MCVTRFHLAYKTQIEASLSHKPLSKIQTLEKEETASPKAEKQQTKRRALLCPLDPMISCSINHEREVNCQPVSFIPGKNTWYSVDIPIKTLVYRIFISFPSLSLSDSLTCCEISPSKPGRVNPSLDFYGIQSPRLDLAKID